MAVSLVVVLLGVALVFDHLWLSGARVELQTAAEAAALQGVKCLVNDETLRHTVVKESRLEKIRAAAADLASQNLVVGNHVTLDESPEGDVRVGVLVHEEASGIDRFLETNRRPTTVVVRPQLSRSRGNPLALFLCGITGQPFGDVTVVAEATADNRVCGLRPLDGTTVPALPLAIHAADPTGKRKDTWHEQIVKGCGADRYGWDADRGRVTQSGDGIPEIVLRGADDEKDVAGTNVRWLDIGNECDTDKLIRQVRHGWSAGDLHAHGAELVIGSRSLDVPARACQHQDAWRSLDHVIGECRVCLLYVDLEQPRRGKPHRVRCLVPIAGRVLRVDRDGKNRPLIVFQPGVLATRTAVLASEYGLAEKDVVRNAYLYKLSLTQ
jgi:hypothetical protein